jgi:L-fuconolactonase
MFGSDWPVCNVATDYESVHALLGDLLTSCSHDQKKMIFRENAIKFYNLDV